MSVRQKKDLKSHWWCSQESTDRFKKLKDVEGKNHPTGGWPGYNGRRDTPNDLKKGNQPRVMADHWVAGRKKNWELDITPPNSSKRQREKEAKDCLRRKGGAPLPKFNRRGLHLPKPKEERILFRRRNQGRRGKKRKQPACSYKEPKKNTKPRKRTFQTVQLPRRSLRRGGNCWKRATPGALLGGAELKKSQTVKK